VTTQRWLVIAAVALIAIAAWPFSGIRRAASQPYVAPILPDYLMRNRTIAFYEKRVKGDPQDQISARILGAQYMQRYREGLDVGDLARALHQARRALMLQPQNNAGADEVIASAYYAMHRFQAALKYETAAHAEQPDDFNALAQMGLLEMEMGHYAKALHDIAAARRIQDNEAVWAAQARYDEMTGRLTDAIALMKSAAARSDSVIDNSAEARAWYHYRLGQMLFSSGDVARAEREERVAIADFPSFEMAYRALARFCWGAKDWPCALDAAQKGAAVIPEPETLGYLADAQKALGQMSAATQTQQLIFAVQRIGNAYHINDRLLSVYYSEHGVRLDDSLAIAEREAAKRGNEIHAQDTLAWAAAMDGQWRIAYRAMREATRFHTQDPRVLFHAGMIEMHFGHTRRARAFLQQTLALNPHFDPFYGDVAIRTLYHLDRVLQTSNDREPREASSGNSAPSRTTVAPSIWMSP
jgi:tetratricopeptide (TPR) repeat protein